MSEPKVVPLQETKRDDIEEITHENTDEVVVEIEHSSPEIKEMVKTTVTVKTTTPQRGFKKFVGNAVKFYEQHQDIINPVLEIGVPLATCLILHKAKVVEHQR